MAYSMGRTSNSKLSETCKSDWYQYKFFEISYDPHKLENMTIETLEKDERLLDLKDELYQEVLLTAESIMTEHQYRVFRLYFVDGYTQSEIAGIMNVTQSAVQKSMAGSLVYVDSPYKQRKYGGSLKKLKKNILKSDRIMSIWNEIEAIRKEC